jgi:hypothetical protein
LHDLKQYWFKCPCRKIHEKNVKEFLAKINKWKLTCWESSCREASRGLMFVNIGQVLGLGDGVVHAGGGVIHGEASNISGLSGTKVAWTLTCWESSCRS